ADAPMGIAVGAEHGCRARRRVLPRCGGFCLPCQDAARKEREQRCVRPWELAQARGFPVTEEAFRAYCAATH
ncbi:MAG TPA: hypothetical protein VLQ88_03020, partial [Chromatiaceae bacterium]|nr:hypothetical protein [Chromatiaceae bacterium]